MEIVVLVEMLLAKLHLVHEHGVILVLVSAPLDWRSPEELTHASSDRFSGGVYLGGERGGREGGRRGKGNH